jgi:hypothetical protein
MVMCDHHGGFIAGSSHFSPLVSDPKRALLACKQAVSLVKEFGVSKLVLELDYLGVVGKLSNQELD